ncbi:MAG TPA: peptide chain release factor 1 [Tepidisphaeraceae bacterium]|jgi:peptide chain release factor 1|nr:peptide chain release factor 1 [Tepidisphaeraceae bacterium]
MAEVLNVPPSLIRKLDELTLRYDELESQLGDPSVLSNSAKLVSLSKEKGKLDPIVSQYREYCKATAQAAELRELIGNRSDPDMAELAAEELPAADAKATAILEALKDEFVAAEDNAVDSFFLEIRAGTGGEEAALFARDLYEMYRRYCEQKRWRFDTNDYSVSERGGFKEAIVNIKGSGAYRHLRFEGGGHRVQRVPETEAQGRIHTSAATVAVMPELPDVKIDINPKDVEEFGCRGGGPGGQNVNKVETGWYISHKPSGLQFKMTEHKSQTQNKERAWALLRATLYEAERAKQHAQATSARKAMMGSGDRSQRIRTYNFPQNRCTDHRLGGEGGGEKNFNLDQILAGQLDPLITALLDLDKQQRLEEL